jgi:hypothetical protein
MEALQVEMKLKYISKQDKITASIAMTSVHA